MRERLHESGEMYLKVIERLTRGKSTVQPIEIAEELGYVKSSVSRAIKLLRSAMRSSAPMDTKSDLRTSYLSGI